MVPPCVTITMSPACGSIPQAVQKRPRPHVEIVERLPTLRPRGGVDDPFRPGCPTAPGSSACNGSTFEHPEAALAQGAIRVDGKSQCRPDERSRLLRTRQVTCIDCLNGHAPQAIRGITRLCPATFGEHRPFGVPLDEAQIVPGALSVPHQPQRPAVVVGGRIHYP